MEERAFIWVIIARVCTRRMVCNKQIRQCLQSLMRTHEQEHSICIYIYKVLINHKSLRRNIYNLKTWCVQCTWSVSLMLQALFFMKHSQCIFPQKSSNNIYFGVSLFGNILITKKTYQWLCANYCNVPLVRFLVY